MTFADAYDPIRALQSAWKLIGRAPAPLIVGGLLLAFFGDGPWAMFRLEDHRSVDLLWFVLGVGLCCGIAGLLLTSWLSVGLALSTEKALVHGSARFEDLFESKGRFFDMVLTRVLLWLIGVAMALPLVLLALFAAIGGEALDVPDGLIALAVFGAVVVWLPLFVYVTLGVSLAVQAVAIEGAKPTEALRRSWTIASGNRLRLLVYWLALWIFALIGLCFCCVGILFTDALTLIAANESYVQLVRGGQPASPPVMDAPPPPPPSEPYAPPAPPPVPPPPAEPPAPV
jgi:hypothetical protein